MRLRPVSAGAGLTLIATLALATAAAPPDRALDPASHQGHDHAGSAMSHASMKQMAKAYWATHKRVGTSTTEGTPAATFTVHDFLFDSDGNLGTQKDVVNITVGQSVRWQWVEGFHTVTSGTGQSDPNSGVMFDQPSDSDFPEFTFTYTSAGTFPFYCGFHELQNMRGTVNVSAPTGVHPLPEDGAGLGFTVGPSPNPTTAGITFRFALRTAGRARAEVFDLRGRRVAAIVDRDLAAGSFAGAWDGRSRGGLAVPGTYYLRLRLPGFAETRRFVITR